MSTTTDSLVGSATRNDRYEDYALSLAARNVQVEQAPIPTPPGFVTWQLKGTKGSRCRTMLPRLLPNAPIRVLHGYRGASGRRSAGLLSGLRANLLARCRRARPRDASCGLGQVGDPGRVVHSPGCGAEFDDSDRRWFDPRALGERS
jgi:hypothetical protein